MKQKRRMWFGFVTVLAPLFAVENLYIYVGARKEWCDHENKLCAKTRLLVDEKVIKYLKTWEDCILIEGDASFLNLTQANIRGANLEDATLEGAVLK